ncbi:hypothetical protein HDN1F_35250 [gamma proteobacterium HdN1]|nr:Hypothetical protein HDN1F_17930 [gamma proteobacterium HdN1]CBL47108.1 hypothetical protein HDN1F_35250 [gamma proteobacterium HdN1]
MFLPFFVSNKRRNTLKDLHKRLRLSWLERAECYVATKVEQYVFLDRAVTLFGALPAGCTTWDFISGNRSWQTLWVFVVLVIGKLYLVSRVCYYKHLAKIIASRVANHKDEARCQDAH